MKGIFILVLIYISHDVASAIEGLLPNGDFELGPKSLDMAGTEISKPDAIPDWEISGNVEYIKYGQKQGDMVLVVPNGVSALRLGNNGMIKQKIKVTKNTVYSVTLSLSRSCGQDEKINVSVWPNPEPKDYGVFPIQTVYSCNGWDTYSWAFKADDSEVELSIHNPKGSNEEACGPLLDSIALKTLYPLKHTRGNLLKNGNFEEGPLILPNNPWGVLFPPQLEDDHSPLPGWTVESLKAVKYVDSDHFSVPEGKRAVELIAGRESAIAQVVRTVVGWDYALTFVVSEANNSCEGTFGVEAYAGRDRAQVSLHSTGRGGLKRGSLTFRAVSERTRIVLRSMFYNMKSDHSGSLCGPLVDDVRLVSVRKS